MSSYEYHAQAKSFLAKHGLRFRATHKAEKCPLFCDGTCKHGDQYRVTISRKAGGRISFDFWNSLHDMQNGTQPHAYDVLACISGDTYCAETFEDFCADFGYDTDSLKAQDTWKRCAKFAKRLQAFFTADELTQLVEIQ